MTVKSTPKAAALPRAPDSLIEYLRDQVQHVVASLAGVVPRKLLVSTGWAVHERVFTFVNRQGRIVVRLPDEQAQRELLVLDGAEPWRYGRRAPPRGWLLLPESMHDDLDALQAWLIRAYRLACDSPAKPPRKKKQKQPNAPLIEPTTGGLGAGSKRTKRSLSPEPRARRVSALSKTSERVTTQAASRGAAGKSGRRAPKPAAKPTKERSARVGDRRAQATTGRSSTGAAKPRLLAGGNPQIAKAESDSAVQAYIAAMPGWKADVGQRLDKLIARHVPRVRKAVKWNSPFYGIEGRGWFLSFHCFTKYIKLTFFRGCSLCPVPPGQSKHKQVRYLDIREGAAFDEAQLADWVRQAAALPGWTP